MSQVRTEIDRIDAALVDLIAERFGYVDRAWQLKMNSSEGAIVQWRIQQVIDRVKARAAERGLPPEMIEMVGAQWRNMIGWFVQFEEEKLRQVQNDPQKSGVDGA
ncbi:chorismate mutase [Hyphomicrobium sp.]|uniref:chorismate mutase n=1 Tax=Hyphomicrobium sp. TaxID=82 RepID=UPI0025BACBD9|nr:chorismate mutase [Hyphomicrobium sp.]